MDTPETQGHHEHIRMTHDQLLALTGDQIKYFEFSLKWPDLLKQKIPFGFPLFLRIVPIQALPWVTLAMWVSSLGFLAWSLAQAGFRRAMILGIVAPLSITMAMRPWLWHGNPYFYANTERLTAILSAILFGLVVMEKDWAASIVTFVMCLVRPAMLFVPVVVLLMRPKERLYWPMGLIFLTFMTGRWAVTGDFGICSYGAIQATRIYAPLVTASDIQNQPNTYARDHLLREILKVPKGKTDTVLDRESERYLYTKWMTGDRYDATVMKFTNDLFSNEPDVEANNFLYQTWSYIAERHSHERLLLYFRALRVALTKIQDPVLVFGLMVALWFLTLNKGGEWCWHSPPDFILMVRWFGLWTGLSILMLLCVQYPDDRYMQICFLWLPSMLGCAIGFVW